MPVIPSAEAPVRPAVLAGSWYSADPVELARSVDRLLDAAPPAGGRPIGLVVPHAGHVYSGPVAAAAFRQLAGAGCELAVIVGSAHRQAPSRPVALSGGGAFETPLGRVEVDAGAIQALRDADPDAAPDARAHAVEHVIEIELPFLQRACPGCRILPILMGGDDDDEIERLAVALAGILSHRRGRGVVIASSDLSHYPSAHNASAVDQTTLAAIETGDPRLVRESIRACMAAGVPGLLTCACGEGPILAAMRTSSLLGADTATVLRYAHSGDTAGGDLNRVVGYGAVMFWNYQPPDLTPERRATLLRIARDAIAEHLRASRVTPFQTDDPELNRPCGAFVTLRKRGDLRGCIGHVKEDTPLCRIVQEMAVAAAMSDTRFDPLLAGELAQLEIEVSVLSPMQRCADVSQIEVGKHGLLIVKDGRRGLLLPEVAEERHWDRREFLEAVCWKAGLPHGSWREGATLYTFTAVVFKE